jgi:hypothetical protein
VTRRGWIAVGLVATLTAAPGAATQRQTTIPVYALLADNTVIRTDTAFGAWRSVRLAPPPRDIGGLTAALALSRDGGTLWALAASARRLVALDAATLRVQQTIELPSSRSPRSLAVGQRTGRIYVASNVVVPTAARRDPRRSVRLAVRDPSGRRLLADRLLRPHGGRSWLVYSLALADDERRAYVSYHGSDTTGLDTVDVDALRLTRCRSRSMLGCWGQPHGIAVPYGEDMLTATGASWIADYTLEGRLVRRLETGLVRSHVMEFAVSPTEGRLYAAGACGYAPGFAAVDLESGERVPLPPSGRICGFPVAARDGEVAVGVSATAVPSPRRRGALAIVDGATGRVLRRRSTRAEPADVFMLS